MATDIDDTAVTEFIEEKAEQTGLTHVSNMHELSWVVNIAVYDPTHRMSGREV